MSDLPAPSPKNLAALALGANLGDRAETLNRAVSALGRLEQTSVLRVSPWCETAPVGGPAGQPAFLNGAALVETALSPDQLLKALMGVEQAHGRVRTVQDGPRTLDLDLLFFNDQVLQTPDLLLPHPRLQDRRFVLYPLAQIVPGWRHPVLKRTVSQLLADLDGLSAYGPSPQRELAGQTAVVLGASKGIGRSMALELARAGARVLCHGRDEGLLRQTCELCALWDVEALPLVADLLPEQAAKNLVDQAENLAGPIHIWVQNAGTDILTGPGPTWSFEEKLARLWAVDARASLLACRAMAERMRARSSGSIITMGWDQADTGMEGDSGQLFGLVKGGVMALTKALARHYAPHVRVNCVAPGWVKTSWGEKAPEAWQRRALAETPLGRWGTPDDIARAVRFLAGPQSEWITGQILRVNGGAVRA
jgi:2-amino-4-hydroxy-6-hydroxymethyldihydropteridine diphosphokinase